MGRQETVLTKEDFLREAIQAKLGANSLLGVDDPLPLDVKAQSMAQAFKALGGTDEELQSAWQTTLKENNERSV